VRLHYTTAGLARGEKYDFWHEVVCNQFVTVDSIKNCDGVFDAQLTCNSFGTTQVSRFDAPAHKWKRDRKHIRTDDQDVYLLGVLRDGKGMLRQNDKVAVQQKGSIALYDTALPFTYDLSASINILTLPRIMLDTRAPHARQLLAENLTCDPGLMAMLCDMIDSLLELDVEAQEYTMVRRRLANSLMDLVLAILDMNSAGSSTNANPRMEKMLAYIRANLSDPDLCPAEIAKFGSISSRTMNRLFAKLGTTPMRWVTTERLRLGERYLVEKNASTVTEAAFMVGFNDISHFSRSFKQLFGYSPEKILKRPPTAPKR
jgi:AraC-like DNA-binding protein